VSELQKSQKRNQLKGKSREKLAAVKMTLIIMAIPLMLILSISTITFHFSSIHSVYAQQSVDNQNQKTTSVSVDGNTYTVNYNTTNARVMSIVPEKESAKVVVTIEPSKEGKLTINLPRELIDYKIAGNKDGNFIVHINAKQISTFKENIPATGNKTSRTLEINFGSGDRTIEIIGTQMAQASVAAIKKQLQNEQVAAAAVANKTKEASLLANKTTTMTKNITNAPQEGGAASIINKTGEVARTFVNKTTGALGNITKSLVGGK
jgi:predicted  nucleic acid-binding Zn-ribbon protein